MIDSLSLAITLGCVVLAVTALAVTLGGGFRSAPFRRWLLAVEVAVVVQAVLAAIGLLRGHRVPELATHLAYLVFSVVVLPVAVGQIRGADGRWAGALVVVALVVQAVLVIRLQTTWRTV